MSGTSLRSAAATSAARPAWWARALSSLRSPTLRSGWPLAATSADGTSQLPCGRDDDILPADQASADASASMMAVLRAQPRDGRVLACCIDARPPCLAAHVPAPVQVRRQVPEDTGGLHLPWSGDGRAVDTESERDGRGLGRGRGGRWSPARRRE